MKKEEFVKHITYNNIEIDVGLDDNGQTYFLEYIDEKTGNKVIECIGAYISDYESYIEWRFGKPEINCPIYHKVRTSETESCRLVNKTFCTECRKFWNDLEWDAKVKRQRDFEHFLKDKNNNENNIT